MASIMVAGGAGFIGSTFVREALKSGHKVLIYDLLTYAGLMPNIEECLESDVCEFVKGDIRDSALVLKLLNEHKIQYIVNFAAESHVDNSINGPKIFIETNILGTFGLLEAARAYIRCEAPHDFRFLQVSTDEVFGELGDSGSFTEVSSYRPNSPYSASKAGADHLVRAWGQTYGLPVIVTNCSNNYGPRQFPEKLIPRTITAALMGEHLPVYGSGTNVRDWIHVEDHARGVLLALQKGDSGKTYCFGGRSERKNIEVVKKICEILDRLQPRKNGLSYSDLIEFVTDRPGHDWRYAIDDSLSERELGFNRQYNNFESGLEQTVMWYLGNENWLEVARQASIR